MTHQQIIRILRAAHDDIMAEVSKRPMSDDARARAYVSFLSGRLAAQHDMGDREAGAIAKMLTEDILDLDYRKMAA